MSTAEDELPEGGLIPSKKFKPLTSEQVEQMGQQAADRYEMISNKIASFPKNKNAEWNYSWVPILGPFLGGAIAGVIYIFLI